MEILFATIFGLLVGSFLNVAIYRLHPDRRETMSIINPPRSLCTTCGRQLSSWENIPVLSWLLLKGRSYCCKERISLQYPIVELVSGAAAAGSVIRFGFTPTAFVVYCVIASLLVISCIDFASKIIPNVISYPGIIIGCALGVISEYFHPFSYPITTGVVDTLIGVFLGSGFLYLVSWGYYLYSKQIGLGGGDIKLLAMTGAILGWQSALPTIVLGSLSGAVIGICLMIFSKQGRHAEIPFGPWLSLGAILYMFKFPALAFFFPTFY